jgi:2-polyprenyl-3-methyl-5-hydroxy-6-metoxy-1,4-benzoquinol methylase
MESTVASQSPARLGLEFAPRPLPGMVALRDDAEEADARGKRIGILIVAYNALSTILPVLQRITPNVWRNVEEIVVLDDASADATYELVVGIKALRELPKLRILKNPQNLGYGGNQKNGYRYFLERGFDVVVLLHGDGQYAPELLAHMYHPIVKGESDAVFGSRMMKTFGGALNGGMPLYKYVGNRILSGLENRMLGMNLTEFHSGYRAYSLHALRQIDFTHMTDDFHFDTEIIVKLHHQHFRIAEVPIPTYYGTEICHVNGLKYAWNVTRALRRYRKTCRSVARAPEFQEYFVLYPPKKMSYSSHYWALRLVGGNKNVLDIGCGHGFLARELAERGNRVTGVDALACPSEQEVFESYHQHDLNGDLFGLAHQLLGQKFDYILLLDVLEHLKSSEDLFRLCASVLKPNGRMIVTLPNVANISIRMMLLFGRFEYTERGILDRAHLRFFTFRSGRRCLEDCDLEILETKATLIPLERLLPFDPDGRLMKGLNKVLALATRALRTLLSYQMLFIVRPRPTSLPTSR